MAWGSEPVKPPTDVVLDLIRRLPDMIEEDKRQKVERNEASRRSGGSYWIRGGPSSRLSNVRDILHDSLSDAGRLGEALKVLDQSDAGSVAGYKKFRGDLELLVFNHLNEPRDE